MGASLTALGVPWAAFTFGPIPRTLEVVQKTLTFHKQMDGFLFLKSLRLILGYLPLESRHFFRRFLFQFGQGPVLLKPLVV